METHSSSERPLWLFSRRADFWLACGGASVGLLAAVLDILWHGDRELDALDFVLSEFHLGATYGVIIQRQLWRHRQVDVLLIPLVILALTYAFSMTGQTMLLTSIAMYAAVWHRGRQSLGVARFYQRGMGVRCRGRTLVCSEAPSICRCWRGCSPTLIWPRRNTKGNPISR